MNSNHHIANRSSALIDLVLILSTLFILKAVLLSFDATWMYAGPISLLATLAVAIWRLSKHGSVISSFGLKRPKSIRWTLLWAVVALVATLGLDIIVQSVAAQIIGEPDAATQSIDTRYQGRFDDLPGNLPVFLFWLAIAWIIGGFAEEILFRAVLISRIEALIAKAPLVTFLAITFQAVLFGYQHYYYQGMSGFIATGVIAFASGVLFILFKRNLWPLVISHGLSNTLGLTLIFLGVMG